MTAHLCAICERSSLPGDAWLTLADGRTVHLVCATEDDQARAFRRDLDATLGTILDEG